MPQSLSPIPLGTPITNKDGTITTVFRLLWQEIQNAFVLVPTAFSLGLTAQNASIATTSLLTTPASGLYRISYYLRKTVADGVSSSLTFTWGWTQGGTPLTETAAALTTDTASAHQEGSILVQADANSDLTYAVLYASNTPGTMEYDGYVVVERMA